MDYVDNLELGQAMDSIPDSNPQLEQLAASSGPAYTVWVLQPMLYA